MNDNLLKRKRREIGLTQDETAAELHISRIAIAQYESKKRIPASDILIRYTNLLGITVDEYYEWFYQK